MRILISNDDGIHAEGLRALVKEFRDLGQVTVIAPAQQRSAFSHSMTIHGHLRYEKIEYMEGVDAYRLWGTPVDCVHVGFRKLCEQTPDIVISGINEGPNLGTDLIYSGTVGAAREAFIHQLPAIAVSLCDYKSKDFTQAARLAVQVAKLYLNSDLKEKCYLNLNVPVGTPKGIKICSTMGWLEYDEGYKEMQLEDGNDYLEVADASITRHFSPDDEDVDFNAIDNGYASLTPLTIDQVAHEYSGELTEMIKE